MMLPIRRQILSNASRLRAYTMAAVLVVIWIFFDRATGGIFLSPVNFSNLMSQTAVTGILAVGMLMVIVSGNIDLSVGSVLGLAGGVAAMAVSRWNLGLAVAVALAFAIPAAIGIFHGALSAYLRIPAFIVTLGGLLAWRGVLKGLTSAETIPVSDPTFLNLGKQFVDPRVGWVIAGIACALVVFIFLRHRSADESLIGSVGRIALPVAGIAAFTLAMNAYAGIPIAVVVTLGVSLLGIFITRSTVFGRHLYAIGGNAEAARLSGINAKTHVVAVYALLGALTGIAALISVARLGSATVDAGTLKELDAIAACVIGGASLVGGRGTVFGALMGALVMASLDNGMGLLGVGAFKQEIVKGGILVAAVGVDMASQKTK